MRRDYEKYEARTQISGENEGREMGPREEKEREERERENQQLGCGWKEEKMVDMRDSMSGEME